MTNNFLKPWEPDYFRKRFGAGPSFAVFAIPMADGTVTVGKRYPTGNVGNVIESFRSMPAAMAGIRKAHPAAVPVWTRGQYWATIA